MNMKPGKSRLPGYVELRDVLRHVVLEPNGGFGFHMWATVVDRDGVVRCVVYSGEERGDQWPGSRVISAQKANSANAFSLPHMALSTANLYSAVQPGGSLYGLQFSNPVAVDIAYGGEPGDMGGKRDPMVGHRIGGINVFGGGLTLYDPDGRPVGALGVSGDSSCTDHIVAWKVRHAMKLNHVPAGVAPGNNDNIIFDIREGRSAGGWGHPECSSASSEIAVELGKTYPTVPILNEV